MKQIVIVLNHIIVNKISIVIEKCILFLVTKEQL